MKTVITLVVVALAIFLLSGWYAAEEVTIAPGGSDTSSPRDTSNIDQEVPADVQAQIDAMEDQIRVMAPSPGATVSSPIQISGEARGTWFFEASAPVVVTNWDGLIIGEGYIEATGDWMTESFVPFAGEVSYTREESPVYDRGTLIFQKANPSDLPANDAAVEIPILFE